MAREIERKFIVTNNKWKTAASCRATDNATYHIEQGYVSNENTVRLHLSTEQSLGKDSPRISIKYKSNGESKEWNLTVPVPDIREMQKEVCKKPREKMRYDIAAAEEGKAQRFTTHADTQNDLDFDKGTVRIRISTNIADPKDVVAYLTLKSKAETNRGAIERSEWEYEIPVEIARMLQEKTCIDRFEKVRHVVHFRESDKADAPRRKWTVDEFTDKNNRVVRIAEVEIEEKEIGKKIKLAPFVDEKSEVTHTRDDKGTRLFSSRTLAKLCNDADGFSKLKETIRVILKSAASELGVFA